MEGAARFNRADLQRPQSTIAFQGVIADWKKRAPAQEGAWAAAGILATQVARLYSTDALH